VSLSWSSTDEAPSLYYNITMNGAAVSSLNQNTSGTFGPLQPSTTYTFTVGARDPSGNLSPISDPLVVTTDPQEEADTTPPTQPGNLTDNGMSFPDGEIWLFWQQSTDNVDPQSVIRYDVYLNGGLDHSLVGGDRTILYGVPNSLNTYTVIAVDSSGNQSTPASITTCAGSC
jgi:chitodextrinase